MLCIRTVLPERQESLVRDDAVMRLVLQQSPQKYYICDLVVSSS